MKVKLLATAFLTAIFVTACGIGAPAASTPDVFAIHTFAAQTVVAELTQTAAANSPTPKATSTKIEAPSTATAVPTSVETATPIPTETPTITPTIFVEASPTDQFCDNAVWVADISVQDGTQMSPGQNFEKTWLIKNTGTCIWGEGYHMVFGYDQKMNGQARALSTVVAPEETVEVTVVFSAPLTAGAYKSYWRMANTADANFGEFFYVSIVVR